MSIWEKSTYGHRIGLTVWKLKGWWVLAQSLFTVEVSPQKRPELRYCHLTRAQRHLTGPLGSQCLCAQQPLEGTQEQRKSTQDTQALAWNLTSEAHRT